MASSANRASNAACGSSRLLLDKGGQTSRPDRVHGDAGVQWLAGEILQAGDDPV